MILDKIADFIKEILRFFVKSRIKQIIWVNRIVFVIRYLAILAIFYIFAVVLVLL